MYDSTAVHCNVKIPRMNKRVGQRSLNYLGQIILNSLPTYKKNIAVIFNFKKTTTRENPILIPIMSCYYTNRIHSHILLSTCDSL